jgi:glycosyltransferase involved in cell wall biosynthesis
MKIGFIWHVAYPWDVRLEKMLNACLAEGHEVSLLCKGTQAMPRSEICQGVRIERVCPPDYLNKGAPGRVSTFPLFFNPLWISATSRFIRQGKFDLVILRDLPLAYLVGAIAKRYKVSVILDMAENYPAALKAYQNILYRPFLVGDSWLPKLYEKTCLRRLQHIIVVTEESAKRLESQGISSKKLTVVGNTPDKQFFPTPDEDAISLSEERDEDRQNLLFVGKIDAHRGIDLVVRVMPNLRQEFPSITFTVVGDGTERHRLEELARSLGLQEAIHFPGWVKFRDTWDYITASTICLIPHLRSEHTDTTLPNKLFDYMALGKPVVASDCLPMKRIISETDCGLTFCSGDVASLENALRRLLVDPQLRVRAGLNGRNAVLDRYNWDVDRKILLQVIDYARHKLPIATLSMSQA